MRLMALRYAILAHSVNGGLHFDLLLEVEGQERLRACQLQRRLISSGESCPWRELEAHRRLYLTFEGEISGGRGNVKRVEQGVCRVAQGRLELQPEQGQSYVIELGPNEARRL